MSFLNSHAQWRLELAQMIGERLRPFVGIRAIVVGGSVARGYADEFSDLELPLFWDRLPDDATRQAIFEALHADLLCPYNGPAQEDNLQIQGFQVDLWHCTVENEEAVFDAVLQQSSTDLSDSNFMDTIRSCIPLFGESLIERWKRLAQQYPEALAERNLQEQLALLDIGHLHIHAMRDNPVLVYGQASKLQQRLFLILLALNGEYFPTYKWMYRAIEKMAIKPQDAVRRMRNVFRVLQTQAVADTIQLTLEVIELVEAHYPRIDTALARYALKQRRSAQREPLRLEE